MDERHEAADAAVDAMRAGAAAPVSDIDGVRLADDLEARGWRFSGGTHARAYAAEDALAIARLATGTYGETHDTERLVEQLEASGWTYDS
jgi:hypothetical protein